MIGTELARKWPGPIIYPGSIYIEEYCDPSAGGTTEGQRQQITLIDVGSGTALSDEQSRKYPQGLSNPDVAVFGVYKGPRLFTGRSFPAIKSIKWPGIGGVDVPLQETGFDSLAAFGQLFFPVDFGSPEARINPEADAVRVALAREISILWREAENEEFQTGFDSQFGLNLFRLVRREGRKSIDVLDQQIRHQARDAYVSAEALKSIGEFDHAETRNDRRLFLERFLNHQLDVIREAAILGLEDLDDLASVPALSARLAEETKPRLLKDLAAAIRFIQR